jgi:hypothetical protein
MIPNIGRGNAGLNLATSNECVMVQQRGEERVIHTYTCNRVYTRVTSTCSMIYYGARNGHRHASALHTMNISSHLLSSPLLSSLELLWVSWMMQHISRRVSPPLLLCLACRCFTGWFRHTYHSIKFHFFLRISPLLIVLQGMRHITVLYHC